MRIYNIWSAVVSCLSVISWNGDGNTSGIIGPGIWDLWRHSRRGASDATVSDLHSGVFLPCGDRVQTILWYLEKLWSCTTEIRGLSPAGACGFYHIYGRNPDRKFPESMDRRKNCEEPEIFLKKISTISSDGFHKICDIWCFVAESVEIVRFCAEKPFDFM